MEKKLKDIKGLLPPKVYNVKTGKETKAGFWYNKSLRRAGEQRIEIDVKKIIKITKKMEKDSGEPICSFTHEEIALAIAKEFPIKVKK